jgi:hypothetical protein
VGATLVDVHIFLLLVNQLTASDLEREKACAMLSRATAMPRASNARLQAAIDAPAAS